MRGLTKAHAGQLLAHFFADIYERLKQSKYVDFSHSQLGVSQVRFVCWQSRSSGE